MCMCVYAMWLDKFGWKIVGKSHFSQYVILDSMWLD